MSVMGGRASYQALRKEDSQVRFVILTGYPLGSDTRELLDREVVTRVQKPLDMDEIAGAIQEALGHSGWSTQNQETTGLRITDLAPT
jgi:ActR/RegA family two-component response regulator